MLNEPVRGTISDPSFYSLSVLEQLRAYVQRRAPATPHPRLFAYRSSECPPTALKGLDGTWTLYAVE